jgi:hypothetical protein
MPHNRSTITTLSTEKAIKIGDAVSIDPNGLLIKATPATDPVGIVISREGSRATVLMNPEPYYPSAPPEDPEIDDYTKLRIFGHQDIGPVINSPQWIAGLTSYKDIGPITHNKKSEETIFEPNLKDLNVEDEL